MCTFAPLDTRVNVGFDYTVDIVVATGEPYDDCDSIAPVFQAASSMWFRPALDGRNSCFGFQVAAHPDLHPSRTAVLLPKTAKGRGEVRVVKNGRMTNGWKASAPPSSRTCQTAQRC